MAKYNNMRDVMKITKALADANRVRALLALRGGELCVCQITELFGLAPSTISKHLSILYHAGLVESRKEGRWTYYRLPEDGGEPAAREAVHWLERSLEDNAQLCQDREKLKKIMRMDPAEICKRQSR